jgi:hypothetical protein
MKNINFSDEEQEKHAIIIKTFEREACYYSIIKTFEREACYYN